ncbi:hypothetical protein DFH29DRAFT_899479, partial [Suillus ampliporus]
MYGLVFFFAFPSILQLEFWPWHAQKAFALRSVAGLLVIRLSRRQFPVRFTETACAGVVWRIQIFLATHEII